MWTTLDKRLGILSLCLMTMTAGCSFAPKTPPVELVASVSEVCKVWVYRSWSPDDTKQTIDGVRQNNAARYRFCDTPEKVGA